MFSNKAFNSCSLPPVAVISSVSKIRTLHQFKLSTPMEEMTGSEWKEALGSVCAFPLFDFPLHVELTLPWDDIYS